MAERTLIGQARIRAGLTMRELGRRSGVGRQAIADLEARISVPRADTVAKLCTVLELDPVEALDDLEAYFSEAAS